MAIFIRFSSVLFILFATLAAQAKTVTYDLNLGETKVEFKDGERPAMSINGSIPGPTLRFTEGDDAVMNVRNDLKEDTSIHWHGLLVPNSQDGVPHVNMMPIKPGEIRTYHFRLRQSGTFWYHSHSVLQEQLGIYGGIVITPKGGERVNADIDYVAVLSDWTNEKPHDVLTQLRAGREWQQVKKGTAQSVSGAIHNNALGAYFKRSMMRMPPMDLSDVAYDAFLTNGKPEVTLSARAGQTVRVRLINSAAMTYYFIEFAGGPVKIVSADGTDVQPVGINRFMMAIAETYDLLIKVPAGGSYELRATAQDGTGHTSLFIGSGDRKAAPEVPRANPYLDHLMMGGMGGSSGSSMAGMDHSTMKMPMSMKMDGMKMDGMEGMNHSKMPGMDMSGDKPPMDHSNMTGMDMSGDKKTGDHSAMDTTNSERPGSPYEKLRALKSTVIGGARPLREYHFHLQGDMIRYVWTIDGKTFTEADTVNIREGELVRFTFTNDTMMHHPMHLHGHFFRVVTEAGAYSPMKHTVDVPPMSTRVIEFAADEPGDWMMHCHILYHAEVGMARIVHYESAPPNPYTHSLHGIMPMHDPIFAFGEVSALSNMTQGMIALENNRNGLSAAWQIGWQDVERTDYEIDVAYDRYLTSFTSVFAGAQFTNDDAGNRGVFGVRYLLPFLIRSQAWVDTSGEFRFSLSQSIPITQRLMLYGAGEYDTKSKWQSEVGLEYILDKRFSLIGQWHSDYGWGGGIGFRF